MDLDRIEAALRAIGITDVTISQWNGKPLVGVSIVGSGYRGVGDTLEKALAHAERCAVEPFAVAA